MRAAARRSGADPTFYPVHVKVGESSLHMRILELLRPLVERWLHSRGKRWFVGADQFIYWRQHRPTDSVSPDLYVLPGVSPDARVTCWKVWETGIVPSFALEVVSRVSHKDYETAPIRHAELGVPELIVLDPEHERGRDRRLWSVYRRDRQGALSLVESTDGDRVRSQKLGCWLRVVGDGEALRARVATGLRGDELFPTDEEGAAELDRRAAESDQRAAESDQRAAREAERLTLEHAARVAAEAEVQRLRAELARRGSPSKRPRKRG